MKNSSSKTIINSSDIYVWDLFVRFFHWSLVFLCLVAFLTEDDFLTLHSYAGYLIFTLLALRSVWGLIGPKYVRFSDFIYRPAIIKAFVNDTLRLSAKRYVGHNPAGGAMVVILMFFLFSITLSGMMLLAAEEGAGPFAVLMSGVSPFISNLLEELHELLANGCLLLVAIHVVGVLVEGLIHRENLVRSMFTGFKRR